jgi:hypothetical protein
MHLMRLHQKKALEKKIAKVDGTDNGEVEEFK